MAVPFLKFPKGFGNPWGKKTTSLKDNIREGELLIPWGKCLTMTIFSEFILRDLRCCSHSRALVNNEV
jgi:hypothetical protein